MLNTTNQKNYIASENIPLLFFGSEITENDFPTLWNFCCEHGCGSYYIAIGTNIAELIIYRVTASLALLNYKSIFESGIIMLTQSGSSGAITQGKNVINILSSNITINVTDWNDNIYIIPNAVPANLSANNCTSYGVSIGQNAEPDSVNAFFTANMYMIINGDQTGEIKIICAGTTPNVNIPVHIWIYSILG